MKTKEIKSRKKTKVRKKAKRKAARKKDRQKSKNYEKERKKERKTQKERTNNDSHLYAMMKTEMRPKATTKMSGDQKTKDLTSGSESFKGSMGRK